VLFDIDYQLHLLWRMTDRSWMGKVGDYLAPSFFDPDLEPVATELLKAWSRKRVLGRAQFRQLCSRHGVRPGSPSAGDAQYDQEEVIRFVRHRITLEAFTHGISLVGDQELEKAIEAVSCCKDRWPGSFQVKDATLDRKKLPCRQKVVSTGVPRIDKFLSGGPGAGDLAVIMCPPGGGKTSWLVWVATNAVLEGRKVAYLTLELTESQIATKYRAAATRQASPPLQQWIKVSRKIERSKGAMFIVEVAPRTKSVLEVEASLGPDIDMLIVDYADYLERRRLDNLYEELGEIYDYLKQIALRREIIVWTGSQANRAVYEAEKAELRYIEGSLRKGMVADQVLGFVQKDSDREPDPRTGEQILRVSTAKNRHGECSPNIELISVNWAACTFTGVCDE